MSEAPLVLVIEDEYLLQADLEQALTAVGFAVVAVSSGEEALTLFPGHPKKYDALVTDVQVNGALTGWDVARRIRKQHAAFPVIYVTGVSAAEWTAQGVPHSILITKPFVAAQLVTALSNLLNIGTRPATGTV